MSPVDGLPLPLFEAGQFVVLRLHVSQEGPATLRSYSLSDLPTTDHFRISVKNEPDGIGSALLCNRTREGDVLEVSAPRGTFTLGRGESPVVLISAGVGATPVMSMLHALASERSTRDIRWIYGARDGSEHPFAEEAKALLAQLPNGHRYIVYSRPTTTDRSGTDYDSTGHIDTTLLKKIDAPQSGDFYLCGPTAFLQSMRQGLQAWGVEPACIHMELFGSLDSITPGVEQVRHTPHIPEGMQGPGPLVSFVRSGIALLWDPKYGSLLELAEACDVPVRWSCRTGVCHTCVSGLISGSVSYSPEPLERPGAGNLLLCCSQATADCLLDL